MTGPIDLGERLDVLFANLMALIANQNRRKGSAPAKASDFLVKWDSEAPAAQMSPLEIRQALWSAAGRAAEMRGRSGRNQQLAD